MKIKTILIAGIAGLFATFAQALTSDEIAVALGIDPSVGTFSVSDESKWSIDSAITINGTASVYGEITATSSSWEYSTLTLSLMVKEPVYIYHTYKTSVHYDHTGYCKLDFYVDQACWTVSSVASSIVRKNLLLPGAHTIQWRIGARYNGEWTKVWLGDMKLEPVSESENPVVKVTNITCTQRTPWNGKVDIDYTVACDREDANIWVYPVGYDKDSNTTMAPRALEGDGAGAPVKAGTHRMTWTVTDDYPGFNSTAFTVKMTAMTGAAPYMVIDLSGGVDAISYPISYLTAVPEGGWGDEYKTTKMVLRLIPSGWFKMGSPTDETGRDSYEDLHGVLLTKPFYIGVFECTQKQYELVMGTNPSSFKGDMRPVEKVSYDNIRGSINGKGWPTHNQVDANSFMGRLRSKANMLFDLPTEAQWEYACRAGTSTALNSGKNYSDAALMEVARCNFNYNDGKGGYSYHTKVGCYKDNAWGLYDMHGNVAEICRDYYNASGLGLASVIDPRGHTSSWNNYGSRICKGGHYRSSTACRSAYKYFYMKYSTGMSENSGFRVYCSPVAE